MGVVRRTGSKNAPPELNIWRNSRWEPESYIRVVHVAGGERPCSPHHRVAKCISARVYEQMRHQKTHGFPGNHHGPIRLLPQHSLWPVVTELTRPVAVESAISQVMFAYQRVQAVQTGGLIQRELQYTSQTP